MSKPSLRRSSQRGMTLVEVMVGVALTAILVLGVGGLWGVVDDHFFRLMLRQKAVFVLNGEVARLTASYRQDAAMEVNAATNDYPAYHPATGHVILKSGGLGVDAVTNNPASWSAGEILFWDRGAAGDSIEDRNVVWLDEERDVVAMLSWMVDADDLPVCAARCPVITVYLDFPYRYVSGGDPANDMGWNETLSVRTVARNPL